MRIITTIAQLAAAVSTIAAALVLLIKPIRGRVLGLEKIQAGQRCLLRSDMLRIYYRHKEDERIRQHEYENFLMEYGAYKALKGNSFVDRIKEEVTSWDIVS